MQYSTLFADQIGISIRRSRFLGISKTDNHFDACRSCRIEIGLHIGQISVRNDRIDEIP